MEPKDMRGQGRARVPRGNTLQKLFCACVMITCVVASLALMGCSTITTGEEQPAEPVGQIVPSRIAIVHTGLVAGQFEKSERSLGIASACHIARGLESQGYDVLMLDSGGSLCGTNLVDLSDGELAIGFLNAAGYDAITLGACELSWGADLIAKREEQIDGTFLSATITKTDDASAVGSPSTVIKLSDGRTVGIIGITSPQVMSGVGARTAQELTSCDVDMAIQITQQHVRELKEQGCLLVVGLANLPEGEGALTAQMIAEQVEGLDVILNASAASTSTHETLTDGSGGSVLVVETAGALAEASVVVWEHDSLAARSYTADYHDVDEQVNALVTQSAQEQVRYLGEQCAKASKELPVADVRGKEIGLGDLVADAALWESRHVGVKAYPDAALIDAHSLKAALPAGEITREAAFAVCPHASTHLYQIQMSGQELFDIISRATNSFPNESDDFPQMTGLSLTLTTKEGEASPQLEISTVGTRKFSLTDTYTLIVTERIANGAGAYASLLDNEAVPLKTSAGKGLINYLSNECKGIVPSTYEKPQGRLTAKTAK